MVQGHATLTEAKAAMISGWDAARQAAPDSRQIMLAYRRVDMRDLNERARAVRQAAGELGTDHRVQTERGVRDRVYFLRNERGLGVKNAVAVVWTGHRFDMAAFCLATRCIRRMRCAR
jgi:ATP-dependent exoDNAse (exonuclease V) alpha subunit